MQMKTTVCFILLLLLSLPFYLHGQSSKDVLEWNEYYKLSWEDFQGIPAEGTFGDAGTAVQIKAKPYMVGKDVHYDVVAYFNRKKSWARDRSQSLLAHEQLHFNIAELYARKIRKKIETLSDNGVNDIETYNSAIKALLLESNDADELYDKQTLHGAIVKSQAEWERKVQTELSDLQVYKKKKRVVGAARLKKQPLIFSRHRLLGAR
jgi:hypothetical protein